VRVLEDELRRQAAVSRSALEESQRRLDQLREQTHALTALRSAHAAALVRGEQLEVARANEAALANALTHLKDALMSAVEERHERAAEAREAQQRLVGQERAAAEAHAALRAQIDALAAELHAANARLEAARVRSRREALARLAREHAATAPSAADDGAQFWRNGAASG
jgi:DNA repair exonuclease SbcCD ATPase subunit